MAGESGLTVWIDSDLCTGDGICAEICPDVFQMQAEGGLHYVREDKKHFSNADPNLDAQKTGDHLNGNGNARVPVSLIGQVVEAAEECPGLCICIEVRA